MNRCFVLLVAAFAAISFFQISAENAVMEDSIITEFVVFKVKDSAKGLEIAHALIEDAKAFNDGIIAHEVYQSASDPHTIAQRITWKSLEKAKEAFAAFETFPSPPYFLEQSDGIIFFDHFKRVKP